MWQWQRVATARGDRGRPETKRILRWTRRWADQPVGPSFNTKLRVV